MTTNNRIFLEESFINYELALGTQEAELQRVKEGEGFWLVSVQERFTAYVEALAMQTLRPTNPYKGMDTETLKIECERLEQMQNVCTRNGIEHMALRLAGKLVQATLELASR